RRRVFMAGLVLFALASLFGGLASTSGQLIAARAVQGVGAAMLSPAALSIVTTTFRDGAERNRALGVWGAVAGSGGAAGVLLGGMLTQWAGWEWVLFVNVPIGIAAAVLAPRILPESKHEGRRVFDVAGGVLVTAGLALLVFAMFFFISLYLQQVLGYSALRTGLSYLPLAFAIIFSAGAASQLVTRVGYKPPLTAGMLMIAGALIWFSQVSAGGSYASDVLFP